MQVVALRFGVAAELFASYRADLPGGALFCPITSELRPGDTVLVEVGGKLLPNKLMVRGTVRSWRRAVPRLRVRAGSLVEIDPEESRKRDFLLACAQNPALGSGFARRRHVRIPIEVPVSWRIAGEAGVSSASLTEISLGGAFLRLAHTDEASRRLARDTEVILELIPPGAASAMELATKVTGVTNEGAGLRFLARDSGGQRRLQELVRRLLAS